MRPPSTRTIVESKAFGIWGIRSRELVEPSLVAIYARPSGSDISVRQIGTGFLIAQDGRPVLVTAKHVLYGQRYDEDPWTKHAVFNGLLRGLFELRSTEIFQDLNNDLAAVHADEFGLDRCLPVSWLSQEATCELILLHGYLARDFRRSLKRGELWVQPNIYVNRRIAYGAGYTGILYPKSKNRDTKTGKIVHASRPAGMSGCPMLDAVKLGLGQVSIVGVFTDYLPRSGRAFGESASKLIALLKQMRPRL
jgi:hypothetical protein